MPRVKRWTAAPVDHRDESPGPTRADAFRVMKALGPMVYAVRNRGYVKIGWTSNIEQRIKSLGSCEILAVAPGTRVDEKELHDRLRGHALRGREWYSTDDEQVMTVVNELRDRIGLDPVDGGAL